MATAWFIGSITIPEQIITVSGSAVTIPAGSYYLRAADTARSLLDVIADAIVDEIGGTCTIVIDEDRRVVIDFNASRPIVWGAGTQVRDLLGFAGDSASAVTHVADDISPLLWSPGYLATPNTIQGVPGYTVPHQSVYKSADGSQVFGELFSTETWQELSWTHIMPERMRVATGTGGGTFHEFFEQCAMLRRRFHYYESIDEDNVPIVYGNAMGPYVLREFSADWYRRNVPYAEHSCPLDLPLQLVAEYD